MMNADPRVREYFCSILTKEESDQSVIHVQRGIEERGWGLWAVGLIEYPTKFLGFIGIAPINLEAHFTPTVEIGWRLAHEFWGQGYATEGALAALRYGFEMIELNEIVAITTVGNHRSRHVMEKIKMHYNPEDDFDHPKIPEGHKLRRCVLYRMNREKWLKDHSID
jgi:3-dehydroquinate dehydratase/shikimate dehydrogenase